MKRKEKELLDKIKNLKKMYKDFYYWWKNVPKNKVFQKINIKKLNRRRILKNLLKSDPFPLVNKIQLEINTLKMIAIQSNVVSQPRINNLKNL